MDVRSERTLRSLQAALLALAKERPLEAITVSDIVAQADVNRSTFYQHYSDKETLLADALDAATEDAGARLPDIDAPLEEPPAALRHYLEHLEENAELYRRVLGPGGSAAVAARLRGRIHSIVLEAVARVGAPGFEGLPLDVVAAGIAGSALSVIEAWLARDPLPSADTATEWVWRVLIGPVGVWMPRADDDPKERACQNR
ncbi:TetR/AcrR family transcriptional regulator [Salinibacterium sp. SYSU T00001]|uniref:TetR/AcrR family transcriptional regulator n=1 Tax=Homoserinimonas sedimenticola TaxID=2986805 RepID=UPI0022368BA5|nr:TetR/AcrR family transcriptional regulator [Salinibacterium sedimenticola]MCW4385995.1 TetR/AcrR family transcriptional regulator [Salinibacterium sedimenticola]